MPPVLQKGLLLLPASARTLAKMVAVFDEAFGPGGSAPVLGKAEACGDADEESSLESLVDIAHVMVRTQGVESELVIRLLPYHICTEI